MWPTYALSACNSNPIFCFLSWPWKILRASRGKRLHTLAQIYLDILDPKISPRAVHLQIYTYDEFIRQRLERAIRPLGPLRGLTRSLFEGRLLFLQGYLHSDEAEPIELKALPAPSGEACALSLHARDQPRTRPRSGVCCSSSQPMGAAWAFCLGADARARYPWRGKPHRRNLSHA